MKCYEGHILTVNQNNDVARYLVEDGGKIVYVGNDLPEQYHSAEVIPLGEKALIPAFVDTHQHHGVLPVAGDGTAVAYNAPRAPVVSNNFDFAAHSAERTKGVDVQRIIVLTAKQLAVNPALVGNALLLAIDIHTAVFLHILEPAAGNHIVIGIIQLVEVRSIVFRHTDIAVILEIPITQIFVVSVF